MKKLIKIALVLISSFCLFLTLGYAQSWSNKKISGNGKVTTKTISTEGYDIIEARGFMDIHLEKGTEGHITVSTEDNLHEYIKIEVKNNTLILKTKKNINIKNTMGIHVTVPFEVISKVAVIGSGNIKTKDIIAVNKFNASVIGSGDIVLPVKASKVRANISGSGDISFSGSTTNLEVDLSGSGNFEGSISTTNLEVDLSGSADFKGFGINSQNTTISVSGSGNAEVVAKENLVARLHGSGDIIYKGNPDKTNIEASGSGSISSY